MVLAKDKVMESKSQTTNLTYVVDDRPSLRPPTSRVVVSTSGVFARSLAAPRL